MCVSRYLGQSRRGRWVEGLYRFDDNSSLRDARVALSPGFYPFCANRIVTLENQRVWCTPQRVWCTPRARPSARIQSGPSHAAKGGAPPPPTIMAIATALPRLLMATAAPAMTWLPLNVVIVDNDRGDNPSSYRARVLRAGAPELQPGTPFGCMQGGSRCPGPAVEPERARWHDPVLGRSPRGLGSRLSDRHSA